jgi:hypothetical protein
MTTAQAPQKQLELIGYLGCAHWWTRVSRTEVVGRTPGGLPVLGPRKPIALLCLMCRAVREAA